MDSIEAQTLSDVMFGAPLADRACGACTACCVITAIDSPELVKAEGQVCPNCTGQGCAIYDARPEVCRTYNCAWKRIADLPPQTRPDRLGVMFTLERHLPPRNVFEHLYFVGCAVDDAAALQTSLARDVLAMLGQSVLPVFVSWDGIKTLVHPEPALAEAIMNPAPHKDRALVAQGRAWLKRYATFARLGAGEFSRLPHGV